MSKEHYVKDLKLLGPDERFRSVFLVQAKDLRQNKKTGDPFLSMQLADCTGTLDARMWDVREGVTDQFQVNDFINVHGRIQVYRERPQIVVHKLSSVPDDQVTLSDFMPHTKHDVEAMYAKVLSLIDSFQDQDLKRLLKSIFENPEIAKAYKKAPAAKSMHHARLGGLLEHVSSVLNLAVAVSANYEAVDRDLLISGVLLHDLGKIYELKSDRSFEYSDAGLLLGHIPIGSAWLGRCCDEIRGFPPRLKMLLVHMVLSHHGKREFGSPQLPAFPEALALHFIDDLDSKLEIMRTATAELTDGAVWSRYPKGLDGPVLDKAAYLRGTSTSSEPDTSVVTSPRSEPGRPSLHPPPAPDLPAATPAASASVVLEEPPHPSRTEFQPSSAESAASQEASEAGSKSERAPENQDEPAERELPAPRDAAPASEGMKRTEQVDSTPEGSQSSATPRETESSDGANDPGPAERLEAASSAAEAPSPQPAAEPTDPPTLPGTLPEAPALDTVAAGDGHGDTPAVGQTEVPQPLAPATDPPHEPAVTEAGSSTSDSERTSSIESGPPDLPPALAPLEPVAQLIPEPGPEDSEQSDHSETEQAREGRGTEAPKIESNQESKPALRPQPVHRPTIVSSPSRASAPPPAPPLPNPPPDSSTANDKEESLQGALFELEEPSAEYPG